ncbi:unnamed protein product, partial [Closterium sp. Naga37s-1]
YTKEKLAELAVLMRFKNPLVYCMSGCMHESPLTLGSLLSSHWGNPALHLLAPPLSSSHHLLPTPLTAPLCSGCSLPSHLPVLSPPPPPPPSPGHPCPQRNTMRIAAPSSASRRTPPPPSASVAAAGAALSASAPPSSTVTPPSLSEPLIVLRGSLKPAGSAAAEAEAGASGSGAAGSAGAAAGMGGLGGMGGGLGTSLRKAGGGGMGEEEEVEEEEREKAAEEDEEERAWEEEQLRKGVGRMASVPGATGGKDGGMGAKTGGEKGGGVGAMGGGGEEGGRSASEVFSGVMRAGAWGYGGAGGGVGGMGGAGSIVAEGDEVMKFLREGLARLQASQSKAEREAREAEDRLVAAADEVLELERAMKGAEGKYRFVQDLRQYVAVLCDFLKDKAALIEELEESLQQLLECATLLTETPNAPLSPLPPVSRQDKAALIEELEESLQQLQEERANAAFERRRADLADELAQAEAATSAAAAAMAQGAGTVTAAAAAAAAAEAVVEGGGAVGGRVELDEFGRDVNLQKRLEFQRRVAARERRHAKAEARRAGRGEGGGGGGGGGVARVEGEWSSEESEDERSAYSSGRQEILTAAGEPLLSYFLAKMGPRDDVTAVMCCVVRCSRIERVGGRMERWKQHHTSSYPWAYPAAPPTSTAIPTSPSRPILYLFPPDAVFAVAAEEYSRIERVKERMERWKQHHPSCSHPHSHTILFTPCQPLLLPPRCGVCGCSRGVQQDRASEVAHGAVEAAASLRLPLGLPSSQSHPLRPLSTPAARLQMRYAVFADAAEEYSRIERVKERMERWKHHNLRPVGLPAFDPAHPPTPSLPVPCCFPPDAVFADAAEEYSRIERVKERMERWKQQHPAAYRDAYASMSAPALFAPFVRLELLRWDPLFGGGAFDSMHWYSVLFDYGLPTDGSEPAPDDPDTNLVPRLVEKVGLPILHHALQHCWDPLDRAATNRAATAVEEVLVYVEAGAPAVVEMMKALEGRIEGAVAEMQLPAWPPPVLASYPAAARFAAQRFGQALRLIHNLGRMREVVSQSLLDRLVLQSILANQLLPHLRALAPALHDAVPRTERLVCVLCDGKWAGTGSGSALPPSAEPRNRSPLSQLVAYIETLGRSVESRSAVEGQREECVGLARRLKRMLVQMEEMDKARALGKVFGIKEAL